MTRDPSHPAFYLPAQELLAGNSRGFWVLDPCKATCSGVGDKCTTFADCCDPTNKCINGYCATISQ